MLGLGEVAVMGDVRLHGAFLPPFPFGRADGHAAGISRSFDLTSYQFSTLEWVVGQGRLVGRVE